MPRCLAASAVHRWKLIVQRTVGLVCLAGVDYGALASPNHDEIQASIPLQTSSQQYIGGRRLGGMPVTEETCEQVHSKPMEPLRIGYEMLDVEHVDPKIRDHIEHTILARAINYWSRTLKTHRVTGTLRAERRGTGCMKYGLGFQDWVLASEPGFTCKGAESPVCGDGIRIPEKYLKETQICSKRCPQMLETVAHVFAHSGGICDNCTTLPAGPGVFGYDYMALVTIKESSFCGEMTMAHASACVKDQCDRPIFGWVNFCTSMVSLHPKDVDRQVSTAIHELAHALAFSSHLFGFFRNVDGTPKMQRDESDPKMLKHRVHWSCSAGSYTWDDPKGDKLYVDLSMNGIVDKFNERGIDSCPCPIGLPRMYPGCIQPPPPAFREPRCVLKLITPKVKEKVREFFDCDWLPGAELENQPTSSCVIVGSHWEERIFMGELMTSGQFGDYIFLSAITLALFEDSGWYMPDYNMADPLVKGVHWGYKLGCRFATEKCVADGKTEFPRFWCQKEGSSKCGLTRLSEVQCTTVSAPVELKPAYTFFANHKIGDTAEADFCPYFHTPISNHVCTDKSSSTFPVSNVNFMREVFGDDSRCLESTIHSDVKVGLGTYKAEAKMYATSRPGCFKVTCSPEGTSYDVLISDLKESVMKLGTCTQDGQALTLPQLKGQVTCAAPEELCSRGLGRPQHVMQLYGAAGPPPAVGLARRRRWPFLLVAASAVASTACFLVRRFGRRPGLRALFVPLGPPEPSTE
mmetsp:Transcript_46643/g.148944  ORF Transcript_46643/g.148944 Transcript_46643/m.148944 type:complete len:747 (+) Transcript_46643:85-2325(+)